MKARIRMVLSILAVVALLSSVVLNARFWWQIHGFGGWRDEVYGLSAYEAARRALDDYNAKRLRLFAFGANSEQDYFTGTNDGPFEVWVVQFLPELGEAHRYSTEHFIDQYNRKMRYMYEHPDKFAEER